LAHASFSDPWLATAVVVAASAFIFALLLLAGMMALRIARVLRDRRTARREGPWREALHRAIEEGSRAKMPAIAASDLPEFLALWNRLQESLRGDASRRLADLLSRHGFAERVLAMLGSGSLRRRLVATVALGHLGEERAWDALLAQARGSDPALSFASARAILRIDPRRALELLVPDLARRDDWPLPRIASVFQELGPALVTEPLITQLVGRPREGLDRMVRLARFAHRHRVETVVRGWLRTSADPAVIAAALNFVEDAEDLPLVRGAARHAEWRVRAAAAGALGRVGSRDDLPRLLDLLRDRAWPVRHAAGLALTRLHGMTPAELEQFRSGASDRFAAEMLAHTIAEAGR
jgi:hypothetical protein